MYIRNITVRQVYLSYTHIMGQLVKSTNHVLYMENVTKLPRKKLFVIKKPFTYILLFKGDNMDGIKVIKLVTSD